MAAVLVAAMDAGVLAANPNGNPLFICVPKEVAVVPTLENPAAGALVVAGSPKEKPDVPLVMAG